MEQRVAGLRREIAAEHASALAVAVQALHPPNRSQNMSREALRSVTVLPHCAHGILSAPFQPRRISSARAPMPKRVATSAWEWRGPKPPSNAERVAALRTSLSLPDLEAAGAARAAAVQQPVQLRESSPGRGAPPLGGDGGEAPQAEAISRRAPRPASSTSTPRFAPSSLASETGGATTRRAAGGGGGGIGGGGGGGGRLEPWADFGERAEGAPTPAPAPTPALAVAERGPSGGVVAHADSPGGPRDRPGKLASATCYPSATNYQTGGFSTNYQSAALQAAEAALRREARASARAAPNGVRLSAAPRRLTSLAARRASPVETLASSAQWSQGPGTARRAVRGGLSGKGSGAGAREAVEEWETKEAIKVLARDLALLALDQLETSSAELTQQLQREQSKSAGRRAPSRSGRGAPRLAPPWDNCPLERKRSVGEWRPGGAGSALGFLEASSTARDRTCNFVGAASRDASPSPGASRAHSRACSRGGSSRGGVSTARDIARDRERPHSVQASRGGMPLPWGLERPRSVQSAVW